MEIELFAGLDAGDALPAGVALLDSDGRVKLASSVAVKHARHRDYAAVLAKLASRRALRPGDGRLGIISTGGPIAVARSIAFAVEALERGPRFVNPLGFPATLPSDLPTGLAADLGAHQFAFVAGWNRLAFLDAIITGHRFLALGLADVVLVIAATSGAGLEAIASQALLPRPLLDVSLAARIGPPTGEGRLITLKAHSPRATPDVQLEWRDQNVWGQGSLLLSHEALATSFAVLLSEIAAVGTPTVARLKEFSNDACFLLTPR
ncbi:hypothetical protein NKH47_08175 [Mesorhizobium sp. M1060]|uniref:hypothetical protein n=1 Tax=Mesorhizobium sp. M1060 TaxID=2957052 RepID=UPI0033388AAB